MTQRAVFLWAAGLAAAVVVTVHFVDFPGSVPRFEKVSGGGVLLDAVPSFTSDAIYARLAGYGAEGRSSYSFRNVTVDLLLPLSVLPFLYLFMRKAVAAFRFEHVPVITVLLAFPLAYVAFDLVENTIV